MELAVLDGSSSVIAQCPEKLSNAGKVIVAQTKIMKKFTMQNSTRGGGGLNGNYMASVAFGRSITK